MVHRSAAILSICGSVAGTALLGLGSAYAHHGVGAQFDLDTVIELQGEVTEVLWRNPHVRFSIALEDDGGQEAVWEVEAQSVTMLRQKDITDVMIAVGDRVRLAGNPAHGGVEEVYVRHLLLADGRELMFADNEAPLWSDDVVGLTGPRFASEGVAADAERGIFKVWNRASGSRRVGNFDVATHPLTASSRAGIAAFDPLTDWPDKGECVLGRMPAIIFNPYPRELADDGDTIRFRFELYDTVRTIHMNPDTTPAAVASPLGFSTGHWEGDTLVVRTTNVVGGQFGRGIAMGDDAEFLERISASDDGSRLNYTITVTDPSAFLEPAEITHHWIYLPGSTVPTYGCLEG
ncbi:MAG: DUF6152 family protein [Candidatus Rariloculaceae bacterium]